MDIKLQSEMKNGGKGILKHFMSCQAKMGFKPKRGLDLNSYGIQIRFGRLMSQSLNFF